MNSKNYVLLWILVIVILWIGLAFHLTTMAVIAIPFQDIFIGLLTDYRVFAIAALLGTMIAGVVYCIDKLRFHKNENST